MEKQRWRTAIEVIQNVVDTNITELFIAGKGKPLHPLNRKTWLYRWIAKIDGTV